VSVTAKSGRFTAADKTGKGQIFRGNRRNMAEEAVVRKISSLRRVVGVVLNLCNDGGQWAGNIDKGECCSGVGKRIS